MKLIFNSKSTIITYSLILIILLIITIIGSMFWIYRFPSSSMEPTIRKNDILIVRKWPIHSPKVGDLVIFKPTAYKLPIPIKQNPLVNSIWLRRIAGEPGDKVYWNSEGVYNPQRENEVISMENHRNSKSNSDKVLNLKKNEYFLVGDNYHNSIDSRHFGPVSSNDIVGIVSFVINR